jgi:hypothetical protein
MKSYWSLIYGGSHCGVLTKKVSRIINIKPIDIEYERFYFSDKNFERADFFLEHETEFWHELVTITLGIAQRFNSCWNIKIGEGYLSGNLGSILEQSPSRLTPFSDLHSVDWEINLTQCYERKNFNRLPRSKK